MRGPSSAATGARPGRPDAGDRAQANLMTVSNARCQTAVTLSSQPTAYSSSQLFGSNL